MSKLPCHRQILPVFNDLNPPAIILCFIGVVLSAIIFSPSVSAQNLENELEHTSADKALVAQFNSAYRSYKELVEEGNFTEALPFSKKAMKIGKKLFGAHHENTAALVHNYGLNLLESGNAKEAEKIISQAIDKYKDVYGQMDERLVTVYMDAGRAGILARHPQESVRSFEDALAIIEQTDGAKSPAYARISLDSGAQLLNHGYASLAETFILLAYEIFSTAYEEKDLNVAMASLYVGKLHLSRNDVQAAKPYLINSAKIFENDRNSGADLKIMAHGLLVNVYQEESSFELATEHVEAVTKLRIESGEPELERLPLYQKKPDYSKAIYSAAGQEYVIVQFDIDEEGFVKDVELIEEKATDVFLEKALEAVQNWRYAPAIHNGKAVVSEDVMAKIGYGRRY